jgi:hypothetical protein
MSEGHSTSPPLGPYHVSGIIPNRDHVMCAPVGVFAGRLCLPFPASLSAGKGSTQVHLKSVLMIVRRALDTRRCPAQAPGRRNLA